MLILMCASSGISLITLENAHKIIIEVYMNTAMSISARLRKRKKGCTILLNGYTFVKKRITKKMIYKSEAEEN